MNHIFLQNQESPAPNAAARLKVYLISLPIKAVLLAGFLSLCALPLTFGLLQYRSFSEAVSPQVCPPETRLEVKAVHPMPDSTNYTCDCLDVTGKTVETAYLAAGSIVWAAIAAALTPFTYLFLVFILARFARRTEREL